MLVYYEHLATMIDAIVREEKLKKRLRAEKIALIEEKNPSCRDLAPEVMAWRNY